MTRFIVTLMFFFFTLTIQAAGLTSAKDTRVFSDLLVDHFIKKEFSTGLNKAKQYWPIPTVEIDGLANKISQQWPIVDKRFGKAISKEFVKTQRIGESFLRHIYLHKFENHSIYWQIDFYKPRNSWKINTILFLDSLDSLYE